MDPPPPAADADAVVTVAYLRDCIKENRILPTTLRVHYTPILVPTEALALPEKAVSPRLAITGYRDEARSNLIALATNVLKVNATTVLSPSETHMLTYDFSGKKYERVQGVYTRINHTE